MKRNGITIGIGVALCSLMLAVGLLTGPAIEPYHTGGSMLDIAYAQDQWRYEGQVVIALPTTYTTATPGLVVDSYGLGNIVSVRDMATPVFQIHNGGNVTGKVLRYATAGSQVICGTQDITDTATITTGLAQSTYCLAQLNATPGGDANIATCTAGTTTVTVKVRNSALTPAANSTGASVTWCAFGTP